MASINTNAGALVALQNLNATNKALDVTQNRVNTGKAINSAKDNGAIWAVAQNQTANMKSMDAIKNSIQRGQSIVDVAQAAGDTVMEALVEMKALAVSMASAPTAQQATYLADINALQTEIYNTVKAADFDGANAFTAAQTSRTGLAAGATVSFGSALSLAIGSATVTTGATAPTAQTTALTADQVQTAIGSFATVMQGLGSASKALDRSLTFAGKLQDSYEVGIGNLVDADLAKESARLTALQTKQQLGVQALSIANNSSSILLGLFR